MGRHTEYNKEVADNICVDIAESRVSLKTICQKEGYPCVSTVYKWLNENKDFSDNYARAKRDQADMLVEEIIEIADASEHDTIVGENGTYPNHEWINRSKLRVDARKWVASKLFPKKYGEKIDMTTDGERINVTTPEQLAAIADKINKNAAG